MASVVVLGASAGGGVAGGSGCGDGAHISLGSAFTVDSTAPPFGAPALVTELASTDGTDDEKPTLTADELEIDFVSARSGGLGQGDVWRSTRASTSDPWSAPVLVAEVSTPVHEKSPALALDGLTLWLGSDRDGGPGGLDIWVSTRDSRDASWSDPVLVPELSSDAADEIPRPIGQHGTVMPIGYRPAASANYQIYLGTRASPGAAWTPPVTLDSIDTAAIDVDGFLLDDGLVLYFSTDRLNPGDQDLFVATRTDVGAPFTTFVALTALNSTSADRDPWLSTDGHELYFTSDRTGSLKIYRATR